LEGTVVGEKVAVVGLVEVGEELGAAVAGAFVAVVGAREGLGVGESVVIVGARVGEKVRDEVGEAVVFVGARVKEVGEEVVVAAAISRSQSQRKTLIATATAFLVAFS
jgi:hypothetical protein